MRYLHETILETVHGGSSYCLVVLLQSTKMMDEFMRMAKANTTRNLETCGVLAGSLVSTFDSH